MNMNRKRSRVWQFFNVLVENNKQAECTACGRNIGYSGSTSNLTKHLLRRHPELYGDSCYTNEELIYVLSVPEAGSACKSEHNEQDTERLHDPSCKEDDNNDENPTDTSPSNNIENDPLGDDNADSPPINNRLKKKFILPPHPAATHKIKTKRFPTKQIEREDMFDVVGKNFAYKLRSMKPQQRIIAEKLIGDVLFFGQLENLTLDFNVGPKDTVENTT